MKTKESVKVDERLLVFYAWLRYRNGWTEAVIEFLTERRHHVETIGRPALEDGHENFLVARSVGQGESLKERWKSTEAQEGKATALQKDSTVDVHGITPKSPLKKGGRRRSLPGSCLDRFGKAARTTPRRLAPPLLSQASSNPRDTYLTYCR